MFHDFQLMENGFLLWRHADIGEGRLVQLDKKKLKEMAKKVKKLEYDCSIVMTDGTLVKVDQNLEPTLCLPQKCVPHNYKEHEMVPTENPFGQDTKEKEVQPSGALGIFHCPHELCEKSYLTYGGLEKHIATGNCKIRFRQESVSSWFKRNYFNHFNGQAKDIVGNVESRYFQTNLTTLEPVTISELVRPMENSSIKCMNEMGSALTKSARGQKNFSSKQKDYLRQIFTDGKQSKSKLNHDIASEKMKRARKEDGSLLFTPKEWLTPEQIKGLFSRWFAELKSAEQPGLSAEEIEDEARDEITLQMQEDEIKRIQMEINKDGDWLKSHPLEVSCIFFAT